MASSYRNIHPVDEILSSLVAEAVPSDNQLIADKVCENIKVPQRSGTLLLENSRNFMGAGAGMDLQRAPGSSRNRIGGFDRSSLTYKCEIYSAEDSIAMEDIVDSQYPGSEEARLVKKVARVMKLAKEKRAADVLFDGANFNTATSTAQFGGKFDVAGSEPLSYLHQLKDVVFENAHGINADTLILGREVFRSLARSGELRGYFQVGATPSGVAGGGSLLLSDEQVINTLRDVLGVPYIHVGAARRDTAVPGAASSESYIWTGDSIFMGILHGSDATQNRNGARMEPVAAVNLEFEAMKAGQYDKLDLTARNVWADMSHLYKVVDGNLGFVLTDCL
jgi:hypothetical protein